MINRPEKFVTGNQKPHHIAPAIIGRDMWRFNLPIFSLGAGPDDQVVMWTDGAVHSGSSVAGEHDGIRDGASSSTVDMRMNFVRFALLRDWVAAGNPVPEE